ncbi:hypothetical protein RHGRI_010529 [Rhododendron griersonianum]|uniref:START domain-containing protein n=1 Tax=Rhododendron griersonianum TaxID=479676 RepID=A0AAV6KIV6_9ERIC|nr:hypothetical protein RHGRI_010529 [Rhododendron griersonianum]
MASSIQVPFAKCQVPVKPFCCHMAYHSAQIISIIGALRSPFLGWTTHPSQFMDNCGCPGMPLSSMTGLSWEQNFEPPPLLVSGRSIARDLSPIVYTDRLIISEEPYLTWLGRRVIWVEHLECQKSIIPTMYRSIVNSSIAFGARHWIATLQQQCEQLVFFMATNVPTKDSSGVATLAGRKSILKLAQRMTWSFCRALGASSYHTWTKVSSKTGDDIRVASRKNLNDPGEPLGVIMCAVSSVWLPVSHHVLFDFLIDEARRHEVVDVDNVQQRVIVKLIPRIDLQALANKLEEREVPKKKGFVPPARFMNVDEAREMRIRVERRYDPMTGDYFENIGGMMFKDGFLYKNVSMKSISTQNIQPTFDEFEKFRQPVENGVGDMASLSTVFANRKKCHFM